MTVSGPARTGRDPRKRNEPDGVVRRPRPLLGLYSSTIVTGPSLTSSISIRAPKRPVATRRPSARRARAEALVERLCHLGARRPCEAGPVPLAGVRDQGELAHDEHLAADVANREIELAVVVFEDSQPRNPAQPCGLHRPLCRPRRRRAARADPPHRPQRPLHRRLRPPVALAARRHARADCRGFVATTSLIPVTLPADTSHVEAARNPWPALGTLLIRDGVITPEQLEEALAEKRATPEKRLGEILIDLGMATRSRSHAHPGRAARARVSSTSTSR